MRKLKFKDYGTIREPLTKYVRNKIKQASWKRGKGRDYIQDLLNLEYFIQNGPGGWSGGMLFHNMKDRYEKEYREMMNELDPKALKRAEEEKRKEMLREKREEKKAREEERKKEKREHKAWIKLGGRE